LRRARVSTPILALDAAAPLPFGRAFDCVVVDAPCSGLGTLRRDPDLKWTRTEADLAGFAATQARMIQEAGSVVRPGGRLVYATCSSEPDENEAIVSEFLSRNPEFHSEPIHADADSPLVNARGRLETMPVRDQLDAFFAAKLVRSSTA
jgi:16S rRNA (cytosine967-C5)-methyltransferase